MDLRERVRSYFDRTARNFDRQYEATRPLWMRIVDHYLRGDNALRFAWSLRECQPLKGKRVLDVGCGSGRLAIQCALGGASEVVGIDLSERMLSLASAMASQAGVSHMCRFIQGDFLMEPLPRAFDHCVALGFFDYVPQAQETLAKMVSLAEDKVLATFPTRSFLRSGFRQLRYRLQGCPVVFYTRTEIQDLVRALPVRSFSIEQPSGWGYDYFVAINVR